MLTLRDKPRKHQAAPAGRHPRIDHLPLRNRRSSCTQQPRQLPHRYTLSLRGNFLKGRAAFPCLCPCTGRQAPGNWLVWCTAPLGSRHQLCRSMSKLRDRPREKPAGPAAKHPHIGPRPVGSQRTLCTQSHHPHRRTSKPRHKILTGRAARPCQCPCTGHRRLGNWSRSRKL